MAYNADADREKWNSLHEEMKTKLISEEECLKMGGHCWNYHSANDVVNERGEQQNTRHLVFYPEGEPQFRTCKHCGKTQKLIKEWV